MRKKFKSLDRARKFARKTGGKVKGGGKAKMADGSRGVWAVITWPKKKRKR